MWPSQYLISNKKFLHKPKRRKVWLRRKNTQQKYPQKPQREEDLFDDEEEENERLYSKREHWDFQYRKSEMKNLLQNIEKQIRY